MRAGALSDPSVAALLKRDFVCAWEKKGAVVSYRVKDNPKLSFKVGGNILSYVCSPAGEVIHVLPGDWDKVRYRRQLAWARNTYRKLADLAPDTAAVKLRAAHEQRSRSPESIWGSMSAHRELSTQALMQIGDLERPLFKRLVGQVYAPDKDIIIREVSRSDYDELLASMPRG